jgi:glycosyltransferase involved in cell wall biosynthesis
VDAGRSTHDVLVVGWYPGADDPIAGRFIADQAQALAASGRVRPWVASFEPFWLHGDRRTRARAAGAWPAAVEAAARAGLVLSPSGAFGPDGIPVARLGSPSGMAPGAGRDNEVVHRARTLEAALRGAGRRIDLIHGHVGYPEGVAAARVAARLGVPFVLTEHATYLARILADPVFRARYREAGLAARRVIAVGKMLAEQIANELPELADRLVVIPNTVDVAAFPVVGPADRDENELLWVGYRREVKGTGVLLRAFARVREARPATTLRLVGRSTTNEEEAGWHALATELGVAGVVRFEPPAGRDDVVEAMSRAGIFVHPGFRETFGMVAVEALASGLPVVATDSGGVTEVLGDDPGALGGLVPAGDPDALAAAIIGALDRRESFDPARLRAHVESRYAAPVVANRDRKSVV